MKVSVIIPCYNEQETILLFYKEIDNVTKEMQEEFTFLFVDDGSKDNTLSVLMELSQKDSRVKYLSFSRNFGKEAAIHAGFSHTDGDYVVMMDADLQDPPTLLPKMLDTIKMGYDSVATRRVTRKGEPPIRSFFARMFYWIMNKISDVDIVDGARDYRLMTAQMKDAILSMPEYNRFSKGIFGWIGFRTKWIEYENVERVAGETKWSFWKLFFYSLEGIVAFSTVPLVLASILGLLFCFFSVVIILVITIRTLAFGDAVAGWPSLVCIMFFIGGVVLFCLGIMGQYLSKIYLETKHRPKYFIRMKNID